MEHGCSKCGGPHPSVRLSNHRFGKGKPVRDPLYTGPSGHCPPNLCLECWLEHWDAWQARAENGGEWTSHDTLLWMMCRGATRAEIAAAMKLSERTLYRMLHGIKNGKCDIPQWLTNAQEAAKWRRKQIRGEL